MDTKLHGHQVDRPELESGDGDLNEGNVYIIDALSCSSSKSNKFLNIASYRSLEAIRR